MTAEAFSSIPFSAGGAVAAAAGRTALAAVGWYMHAPLRNTAVAALVVLSAMAGSNALYNQARHHPAPLFGNFETSARSQGADPVMPAARPTKLEATPAATTSRTTSAQTKPAPTAAASKTVGNEDVLEIQRKLQAFGMLDGKADGLFGQRTSRAIKAFEAKAGRPPKGELTAEIVTLIKAAPLPVPAAATEPAPAVATPTKSPTDTAPALTTSPAEMPSALALTETPARVSVEVVEPVEEERSLPVPAPLVGSASATASPEAMQPEGQATAVTGTTDAAAQVIATDPEGPASPATTAVPKRTVQTIAVRATQAAPTQAIPDQLETPPVINVSIDPKTVAAVQRGLASLGFLHGEADGVAGEATAKAIRNFETYFNYDVTGRVSPDLVKLLVQNGAVI